MHECFHDWERGSVGFAAASRMKMMSSTVNEPNRYHARGLHGMERLQRGAHTTDVPAIGPVAWSPRCAQASPTENTQRHYAHRKASLHEEVVNVIPVDGGAPPYTSRPHRQEQPLGCADGEDGRR